MRAVGLAGALFVFWLALSGHYNGMLISLGVLSTLACAYIASRFGSLDEEGFPAAVFVRAPFYWAWLVWEIVKSAWAVTKIIVDPRLPITPTMTRVRASQKSTTGIATYANSITLTPGTITTGIKDDELTINALVREGADDLEGGGMDQQVSWFEGAR